MTVKESKTFNQLNNDLNYLMTIYDEEYIFGLYCYEEHPQSIAVVVPSFEDICINEELINEDIYNDIDRTEIKVIDAKYLYRATKSGFPEIIYSLYTDYYVINPRYEHIYEKYFRGNRDAFVEGIKSGRPAKELKNAVITLVRAALNDNSKAVRFIKSLTDLEKSAVEEIVAVVGDEGVFSQAKVASAAGISRVAMTNLVMKIKLYEVGEVRYYGNKGTYIKILDDTLLNIRGNIPG